MSKDINLRIKAAIIGVHAEDYYSDKTIEDADLLYTGVQELPANFWESTARTCNSWQEHSRTFYRVQGPMVREWHVNQFLYQKDSNGLEALVRSIDGNGAVMELVRDYRNERHSIWGITARNREQNFALNLLLDPEIDFVTILGPAGTGKTLLTLAAGLAQTLESNRYSEIIMTRVTIPLGEDIGFLPGTEEEKMEPWMGALMDNLEVLTQSQEGGNWGRAATNDLLRNRIKIRSLNFMRGRTFLNRFLILDEAQNLTPKQMKALVTRAGPGTKLVCLGNIAQIDTPYLTETTSGLTYVVNRFRGWEHSGHITLMRGERSRLADYASDILCRWVSRQSVRRSLTYKARACRNVSSRLDPARPARRVAGVAGRGDAGARAESASGQGVPGALHRAGVHVAVPGHRPARFRAPRHRLRAAALAGREQVAEAVSRLVPQSRRVPRGLHAGDRRPAGRLPEAALAAHRRLLVSARRHADRRVLADRQAAGGPVDSRPGRRGLQRARLSASCYSRRAFQSIRRRRHLLPCSGHLWRLASVSPRRSAANPARPGREQR